MYYWTIFVVLLFSHFCPLCLGICMTERLFADTQTVNDIHQHVQMFHSDLFPNALSCYASAAHFIKKMFRVDNPLCISKRILFCSTVMRGLFFSIKEMHCCSLTFNKKKISQTVGIIFGFEKDNVSRLKHVKSSIIFTCNNFPSSITTQ